MYAWKHVSQLQAFVDGIMDYIYVLCHMLLSLLDDTYCTVMSEQGGGGGHGPSP